jgi:hypothetical protein
MENVKIRRETKELLKNTIKQLKLGTYNEAINDMCGFFTVNHLHPKDTVNGSFFSRVQDLERKVLEGQEEARKWKMKDSNSLRKLLIAFENQYLAPTVSKLNNFDKNKQDLDVDSYVMPKENEAEKEVEILREKLRLTTEHLDKKIEENKRLEEANNDKEMLSKNNEHKEALNYIRDNYKLDTNAMGRERVFLNIKGEEFFKIFKILD